MTFSTSTRPVPNPISGSLLRVLEPSHTNATADLTKANFASDQDSLLRDGVYLSHLRACSPGFGGRAGIRQSRRSRFAFGTYAGLVLLGF